MKKYIFLMLGLCACSAKQDVQPAIKSGLAPSIVEVTSSQAKVAGIDTGRIEERNISSVLKVSGVIEVPPENIVSVSFPLGGYLKSTALLPGKKVRRGEPIAVLEDQQFIQLQQDYLTSQTTYAVRQTEFNRQKELNASKATSDKLFEQVQAEYHTQGILLKALREKLLLIGIDPEKLSENNISRKVNIYSPIDGYVSKVNVNIGKYIDPSDVLFEIINPNDIHLSLTIFEKDIHSLFDGQEGIAYTNIDPNQQYPFQVMLINRQIASDRSVEVQCHFKEHYANLFPGTFMNGEIQTQQSMAHVLPSEAIVSYENKQYVFMAKHNNQFELLEIGTGISENGYTQIMMNDLAKYSDASFVTRGAYSLLMKMKNTDEE